MIDETSLWWEHITGPLMLVDHLATLLADGKSVILRMDTPLPWREQMRDYVMHRLDGVQLNLLQLDHTAGQYDIVSQLLEQYHRQQLTLCPPDYGAQLHYLKNEHILGNSVVWILSREEQEMTQAARFASDYRGKDLKQDGAFVVEVSAAQPLPHLSNSVEVIQCSDHLRFGDVRLFSSILADEIMKIPIKFKSYAACMSANLAGMDAELIPVLLQRIKFEEEEPREALLHLQEEGLFPSDRLRKEHEIERIVWKSQLQSVFAGIEMERLRITDEQADKIEDALATEYWNPQKNETGYISQHGDKLETASDVELGTLGWMMALRRNGSRKQSLLSFSDESLRDWIFFLTECRNNLAHHRSCSPEKMYRLLNTLQSE